MALELLAPAKNADQGILALRCGADALYMGGPGFGARKAAARELTEFETVCREARLWGAKVYATLNTLLYDHELEQARRQAARQGYSPESRPEPPPPLCQKPAHRHQPRNDATWRQRNNCSEHTSGASRAVIRLWAERTPLASGCRNSRKYSGTQASTPAQMPMMWPTAW